MMHTVSKLFSACVLALVAAGCVSVGQQSPAPNFAEIRPPAVTPDLVKLVPPLKSQRFSMLLDFETNSDGVFIAARPPGRMVYDRSHTGRRSLRIDPGTERVAIKIGSLLAGRAFPANWTLLGGFIYCDSAIELTLSVESAGISVPPRKVTLTPTTWTAALLDISSAASAAAPSNSLADEGALLVITLPPKSPAIWCDDVLLIDNTQTLVNGTPAQTATEQAHATETASIQIEGGPVVPIANTNPSTAPTSLETGGWSVQRRGLSYVAEAPGFNFQLITTEASRSGWKIEEANSLRARFTSAGTTKQLTVYSDGRSYWDGEMRPMSAEARDNPVFQEEHASPAEIVIAEDLGRINRTTAGDANNDGYNEQRGAYQLIASESRLELKLIPRTSSLARPVLEVTGLSPGKVLATVEGRLIESVERLSDGTVLVELPVRINRPTTVNLRLQ